MALILLIRHALTEITGKRLAGRTPGLHLSAVGVEQAERLAERLRAIPLAAMYSSPLERCIETAAPVAAGRSAQVDEAPELVEIGYGTWTGRPLASLARTRLWSEVQRSPSTARFPDGESLADAQRRAVGFLDGIAVRHPKKIVAAFSHADVIRLALSHYAGAHIDLFQRLIVSPASVSAVLLGDRIPRVVRMNDVGSLDDLVPRSRAARSTAKPARGRPTGPRRSVEG
jgi:probable phosphomutase (TIGR03848 family)